jgi:hypothetical protein
VLQHTAAWPSQQQVYPHRTHHQPEHRQLHPQPALQVRFCGHINEMLCCVLSVA